ncbi:MAG: protein-L-isoaspartate(D-aspartate) O-methyltransferase [Thermoanaerobaculia bacterium]|nr:protein-L-isoaspartate(D-aspartate) O-methyltransferase [Thermoanaerobaculia bacterium]
MKRIASIAVLAALAAVVVASAQDRYRGDRQWMVEDQLRRRGIHQPDLLNAMETVPRHLFVAEDVQDRAYSDGALAEGPAGGLLQPYMTALMIELLELDGTQKVLEIGTGSGYDAAVLSRLAREVYTIEISPQVGAAAKERLRRLGYENVQVRIGDGHGGWPSEAPFDAIILTAAPPEIPPRLIEQLKPNGKMVVPVGGVFQDLTLIEKTPQGLKQRRIEPVRVAPMSAEEE